MNAMIGTIQTFATRFAFAVDMICQVLWREGLARGPQELARLTNNRIRRLERRFNALLARWRAGTLRAVGAAASARPTGSSPVASLPQSGEGEVAERTRAPSPFPRGWGWIVRRLAPVTGQPCVGALCVAWEEPGMAEFYAAAPQVGRILRPLAHMIGAPLPAWLRLPKRAPDPAARQRRREAAARRRDERAEMIVPNRRLPPKEQVDDAMRRWEAYGKPIDVKKFTDLAYGQFVHAPRDGNCPPLKIGYGGRRRRPPKDYKQPPKDEE